MTVPPAPARVPQIEVAFDLDSNGILQVFATNKADGMQKSITIVNDKGRLSADEIQQMLKEADRFKNEDNETRTRIENQLKLTYVAKNMLAFTEKPQFANKISN